MTESALNALAGEYLDLVLCKSLYDKSDIQWYTEGPFWRRTSMRYSRDYKILPDYEIGERKHGRTLEDILAESAHLKDSLALYQRTARPQELQRVSFLIDHVGSLHTRTRLLLGERMSYDEMSRGLFNLVAPPTDHRLFDDMAQELRQVLPGGDTLRERAAALRERLALPRDRVLPVLRGCTQAFHDFSMAHMTLTGNSMPRVRVREYPDPDMHFLSILFGYDYNHLEYERNFNLRYVWTPDDVVETVGHENEPGHLTFYEKRLQTMIDTCWPEMAVIPQSCGCSAFTEGSARVVTDLCFGYDIGRKIDFEREYIFSAAGLDLGLLELMPLWHRYRKLMGYGRLEAFRNVRDGIWSHQEALAFLGHYAFCYSDAEAERLRRRMDSDAGHHVSHDFSRDVVERYFLAGTHTLQEQWRLYERLCCGHMSMEKIQDGSFCPDDGPLIW